MATYTGPVTREEARNDLMRKKLQDALRAQGHVLAGDIRQNGAQARKGYQVGCDEHGVYIWFDAGRSWPRLEDIELSNAACRQLISNIQQLGYTAAIDRELFKSSWRRENQLAIRVEPDVSEEEIDAFLDREGLRRNLYVLNSMAYSLQGYHSNWLKLPRHLQDRLDDSSALQDYLAKLVKELDG